MKYTDPEWQPRRVIDVGPPEKTSTGVTRVATDAGEGDCKVIGNRQGSHLLACEWACVRLARWFGLPTFKAAIVELTADRTFDLPEHKGHHYHAEPGPAFVTRPPQDASGMRRLKT